MIRVFIETNFLINISFKQEEYKSSYKLLKLAEKNKIKLCLPSLCISEAYWVFAKENKAQLDTKKAINDLINKALRSSHSRRDFENYRQISTDIDKKLDKELKMLDRNINRVLKIVELIKHNTTVHRNGIIYRSKFDIKHEPDAFIVSAVVWYKTNKMPPTSHGLFVTADSGLVNEPKIMQLMHKKKIELKSSFKESVETLKSKGVS